MDIKYFSFSTFYPSFGSQRQAVQLQKLYKVFFKNMVNKNSTWTTDSVLLLPQTFEYISHSTQVFLRKKYVILLKAADTELQNQTLGHYYCWKTQRRIFIRIKQNLQGKIEQI